jgi:hypothetical protein
MPQAQSQFDSHNHDPRTALSGVQVPNTSATGCFPSAKKGKEGSPARLRKGRIWGSDALLAYGNGAQSLTVTVARSDRQPRKCHRPPSDQIQTPLHRLLRLPATTSVLKVWQSSAHAVGKMSGWDCLVGS